MMGSEKGGQTRQKLMTKLFIALELLGNKLYRKKNNYRVGGNSDARVDNILLFFFHAPKHPHLGSADMKTIRPQAIPWCNPLCLFSISINFPACINCQDFVIFIASAKLYTCEIAFSVTKFPSIS